MATNREYARVWKISLYGYARRPFGSNERSTTLSGSGFDVFQSSTSLLEYFQCFGQVDESISISPMVRATSKLDSFEVLFCF